MVEVVGSVVGSVMVNSVVVMVEKVLVVRVVVVVVAADVAVEVVAVVVDGISPHPIRNRQGIMQMSPRCRFFKSSISLFFRYQFHSITSEKGFKVAGWSIDDLSKDSMDFAHGIRGFS